MESLVYPVVQSLVGSLVGPVVRSIHCFRASISQNIGYLRHLNNNIETLRRETEELKSKRDEIRADVDDAIAVGKTQKPQVDDWLRDVSNFETEVESIRLEFEQRRTCLNGCCTDHFSRYKLGKRVVKMNEDVQNLKEKGVFDMVAASPRGLRVLEMQTSLPRRQQSTSKQTLEEIWQCLHDGEKGIICVVGMGGIGKTTLMKAINKRLIGTHDFIVIWVTVSRDLNLGSIQEKIGKKLAIKFDDDEVIEEKRNKLFNRLKNVRYMLILDDLWQELNLDQVGIPKPDAQNRCKIVITTRSVEVCNVMRADKQIKVKTLTHEDAWTLFCELCGDVVLSSKIRPVAEKVVEECGGLPLAIKTMGRAMCHKDKKELWENALRALKGSSPDVLGMEREVFLPLKLSYDYLEDDRIKLCFLYCSLFPEDYDIEIDNLVTYWAMEEGFIENVNNLEEASNKGHYILERIKDACLLEDGFRGDGYVRMHDLLRDLAIWITSPLSPSSSSNGGSKFLVQAGKGLVQPPEEKMWGGIVRISLMHNKIKDLGFMPNCPNLVSLFLKGNNQLSTIHDNFFELMPKLQILDLSDTSIKSLPMSLSLLVNLRALILRSCRHLVEVPPLEKLKELQLLDLSNSGFKNLPPGIASLVKLKQLDLSFLNDLAEIPCNMISGLSSLEDLSMLGLNHMDEAAFSEVATLIHLSSLSISVSNLNVFIADDMFRQRWSGLRRFNVQVGSGSDANIMGFDKEINIQGCENFPNGIEELIKHASSLCFKKCKSLTSLSRLVGDSKSLKHLEVIEFSGMECIIDWREVGDDALQCLEQLNLCTLLNLENVFGGRLPRPNTRLQRLRKIVVADCHRLRCLFSSNMVEHLNQLEELQVLHCIEIEEIIEGEVLADNSFPRLRSLRLKNLSKLERICGQQLIFISLEEIGVISCTRLKKLPLLSSSVHGIHGEIEGEREWWEGLEWEDENAKVLYSRVYRSG